MDELENHCKLNQASQQFLQLTCDKLQLSARAYHRVIKLARTIADMGGIEEIGKVHLSEAIGYRSLDRR